MGGTKPAAPWPDAGPGGRPQTRAGGLMPGSRPAQRSATRPGHAVRSTSNTLSSFGAWRSLVARTVRVGEVPGSNPGAPTAGSPPTDMREPAHRRALGVQRGKSTAGSSALRVAPAGVEPASPRAPRRADSLTVCGMDLAHSLRRRDARRIPAAGRRGWVVWGLTINAQVTHPPSSDPGCSPVGRACVQSAPGGSV
jgi:hypothetical protein